MSPATSSSTDTDIVYQLGPWSVQVERNRLTSSEHTVVLEPKVMDVLVCLIEHHGHVVSKTELLDTVWAGRFVVDGVLKRGISKLRAALGDDARQPQFIETVQRRGYRLVCPVESTTSVPLPAVVSDLCPFRGLSAFRYADADIFFGRDRQIAEVIDALERQRQVGRAFVLISGPSGCGKSSLARAGVLPAICAQPDGCWPYAVVRFARSAGDTFEALASALCATTAFGGGVGATSEVAATLREGGDELVAWLDRILPKTHRLTVLFDQFEELFADGIDDTQREAVIDTIHALARSGRVNVLATLRNDQFHWFAQSSALESLRRPHGHVEVRTPGPAQIAQIIREPAARAGLRFDVDDNGRSLDDALLGEAQDHAQVLPLLEFALTELYEQRDDDGVLRFDAYRALGGIDGCVARRAEQVFANVPAPAQSELPRLLSSMVEAGRGLDAVSLRSAALPETAGSWPAWPLVNAFVDARLFTLSGDSDGENRRLDIAHEAVLRLWPRARRWLERNLQLLRTRAWLREQAVRWRDADRHHDFLLRRGQPLTDALAIRERSDLDADERDFVHASQRRAHSAQRLRRTAVVMLAVLATVTTATTFLAARQRAVAEEASERSTRIADFLGDVFRSADPLSGRRESLSAQELLDRGSRRVTEELAGQPDIAASLLHTMGEAYFGLGDYAASADALRQARVFVRQSKLRPESELALGIDAVLARALVALGELDEARAVVASALAAADASDVPLLRAQLLEERGMLAYRASELEDALRDTEAALDIRRATLDANDRAIATCHVNLGAIENAKGNAVYAESHYLRAIDIYRALSPEADDELAAVLNNLANVYRQSGRADRAEERYRDALSIHAMLYPADHPDTAGIQSNLGSVLRDLGRLDEATTVLDQSHQTLQRQLGVEHPTTCLIAVKLADVLIRNGNQQRGLPLLTGAREQLLERYGNDHYLTRHVDAVGGTALAFDGQLKAAEMALIGSREAIKRLVGGGSPFYLDATRRLAEVYEMKGDADAASALRTAIGESP
ncbi:MAG: tetratricopeptide repeat protein [Gammaproteobacteria bacterium]